MWPGCTATPALRVPLVTMHRYISSWGKRLTEIIFLFQFVKLAERVNTHCVTLVASRLRSLSLLTIARSPPRFKHCFRASVQLSSPGRIWKQLEDSWSCVASTGQKGEAGREQKHECCLTNTLKVFFLEKRKKKKKKCSYYFIIKKTQLKTCWSTK